MADGETKGCGCGCGGGGFFGGNMIFLLLIIIILFRREGIMGMKEWSWDGFFARFGKGGKTE